MVKVGVVGASGYTGIELVGILSRHPGATIAFVTSESNAGARLSDAHPAAPPLPLIALHDASLDAVDVIFLCLPHGVAAPTALEALAAGVRVIDLSADFRLLDAGMYRRWYGIEHPAPGRLSEAVYGLTEFARHSLPEAHLVANPGCYPTSILLPLRPLLLSDLIDGRIIADSKSGVSGAGRVPKQHTHFVEVAGNFSPYSVGRAHRHLPEIEQQLQAWHPGAPSLIFSPHLLPVPRGILSTIYVTLARSVNESSIEDALIETFVDEPFVDVLPSGEVATLAHAVGTNRCVIGTVVTDNVLVMTSAIDNLIKGAAGQAVQNMNVMFGLPETEGLM